MALGGRRAADPQVSPNPLLAFRQPHFTFSCRHFFPLSLSFWHRGEPDDWRMENGDGEDCVRMGEKNRVSHNWYDRFCETQQRHICEKDLDRNSWTCD